MATQPDTAETGGHSAAARSSVPAAARDTAETGEQTLSVLLSSAGATLRADLEHQAALRLRGQEICAMVY